MYTLFPFFMWMLAITISVAVLFQPSFDTDKLTSIVAYTYVLAAYYLRNLIGFIEEFFILIIIIPFWFCVNGFVKHVEENFQKTHPLNKMHCESIKTSYLMIRNLTTIINDIIWPNMALSTILSFGYYSFNFGSLSTSRNLGQNIRYIVCLLNAVCFYYLGADISHRVRYIMNVKFFAKPKSAFK